MILNPTDDVIIRPTDDVKLTPTDDILMAPGDDIGIFSSTGGSINWNRKSGSNLNVYTTANSIDAYNGTGTLALPSQGTTLHSMKIHGVNQAGSYDATYFAAGVEIRAEAGVDWAAGSNYGSTFTLRTVKTGATALEDRIKIFHKMADLLAGPYRNLINASTMLGQSKNIYQAEIDSACELIDFLRFNVEFVTQIYSNQPESNSDAWNLSLIHI